MIMVNPVVQALSPTSQTFNHACLSVPCANRCEVRSPLEMRVSYQDPLDKMRFKTVSLSGIDAVVLWHELTHILEGKTYMDVVFERLARDELLRFRAIIGLELHTRQQERYNSVPELSVPPFHVTVQINEFGQAQLKREELAAVLVNMTTETLWGLFTQVDMALNTTHS